MPALSLVFFGSSRLQIVFSDTVLRVGHQVHSAAAGTCSASIRIARVFVCAIRLWLVILDFVGAVGRRLVNLL